jgi:hypothetical protein
MHDDLAHLLRQPHLDERLIRHVALVGGDLDLVEQALRQPQRDRRRRQLQVGEADPPRLAQIEIVRGIVRLSELAFLGFALELRDRFKLFLRSLRHVSLSRKSDALSCSWDAPR